MRGSPGFTGQLDLLNDACHQVLYFFDQTAWLLFCFFFAAHFSAAIIRGQCLFFSEAHRH